MDGIPHLRFLESFSGCLILFAVVMVLLAGPLNEVRSMITGRYRLPRDRA